MGKLSICAMVLAAILLQSIAVKPATAQTTDEMPDEGAEAAKTKPIIPNEAGIWSGTINDTNGGVGSLDMTLTQHNRAIKGIWETSFDDPTQDESGALSGTVLSDNSIKVTLVPSARHECKVHALGLIEGANEVAGNYTAFACPRGFSDSGSFDIGR